MGRKKSEIGTSPLLKKGKMPSLFGSRTNLEGRDWFGNEWMDQLLKFMRMHVMRVFSGKRLATMNLTAKLSLFIIFQSCKIISARGLIVFVRLCR